MDEDEDYRGDELLEDEHDSDAEAGEVAPPNDEDDDPDQKEDLDWRSVRKRLKEKDETIKRNEEFLTQMDRRHQQDIWELKQALMNKSEPSKDDYDSSGYDDDPVDDEELRRLDALMNKRELQRKKASLKERNTNWKYYVSEEASDFEKVVTPENLKMFKQRRPRLYKRLDSTDPNGDKVEMMLELYEGIQSELGKEEVSSGSGQLDDLARPRRAKIPVVMASKPKKSSRSRYADDPDELNAELLRYMR